MSISTLSQVEKLKKVDYFVLYLRLKMTLGNHRNLAAHFYSVNKLYRLFKKLLIDINLGKERKSIRTNAEANLNDTTPIRMRTKTPPVCTGHAATLPPAQIPLALLLLWEESPEYCRFSLANAPPQFPPRRLPLAVYHSADWQPLCHSRRILDTGCQLPR